MSQPDLFSNIAWEQTACSLSRPTPHLVATASCSTPPCLHVQLKCLKQSGATLQMQDNPLHTKFMLGSCNAYDDTSQVHLRTQLVVCHTLSKLQTPSSGTPCSWKHCSPHTCSSVSVSMPRVLIVMPSLLSTCSHSSAGSVSPQITSLSPRKRIERAPLSTGYQYQHLEGPLHPVPPCRQSLTLLPAGRQHLLPQLRRFPEPQHCSSEGCQLALSSLAGQPLQLCSDLSVARVPEHLLKCSKGQRHRGR